MLHALNRNKSKLYQRYLGHREPDEPRVAEEDEITALIMGPLAFLPPAAIGFFWTHLLQESCPDQLPQEPVTAAQMSFWPRRPWTRVEPDLRVDLWWATQRLTLVVEFKWRSPLSGEDQLHRQWNEFLTKDEQARAVHVFIAPDISEGVTARVSGDIWEGQLVLRSWFDVLNVLVAERQLATAALLKPWATEVVTFLQKLAIRPQRGFQNIAAPSVSLSSAEIFWKGLNGFNQIKVPDQPIVRAGTPIFFKS